MTGTDVSKYTREGYRNALTGFGFLGNMDLIVG
jgi:hypothetical protein